MVGERLAISSVIRTQGDLIWIHAASVGEMVVASALIAKLKKELPKTNFLLTTWTITSANLAKQNFAKDSRVIHQLMPVDNWFLMQKFVKHWKPHKVMIIEAEIWPNLIKTAKQYTELFLLNAKMSDESFKFWKKVPFIIKPLLESFTLILTQSQKDTEKFQYFLSKRVKLIGNLKYSITSPENSKANNQSLAQKTKERNLILAASTHEGEESIVLDIFNKIKYLDPTLLLILAPRHPHRKEAVLKQIKSYGLKPVIHSTEEKINKDIDVYLLDTLGELDNFFKLKPLTIMCGSLVKGMAGHNILAPAMEKCPIIFGPYMKNYKEIAEDFVVGGAAIQISNGSDLIDRLTQLLQNPPLTKGLTNNAMKILHKNQDILDRYWLEIKKYFIPTK